MQVKVAHTTGLHESLGEPYTLDSLPILVIHAHSSCNCRCIMCDIWKIKENKVFGVGDLGPQLDSIRRLGVRWIVFSGGEPLMNPELPQLCSLLRKEGIRLTLLSTGLLLRKCANAVTANFDEVIVSLDGPSEIHDRIRRVEGAFALLESGIQALRDVRPEMHITARSTVQKANHNCLVETARAAKQLKLDSVSFLAADLTSSAFNRPLLWPRNRQEEIGLSLSETVELEKEIETLIRDEKNEFGSGFIVESAEKLRKIVGHFRAQLGLEEPQSPACNAPWVSAVIEADGSVRPCFFHPSMGNLRDTTLEAAINGDMGRNFRKRLDIANNPVCKRCVCSLNYRPLSDGF